MTCFSLIFAAAALFYLAVFAMVSAQRHKLPLTRIFLILMITFLGWPLLEFLMYLPLPRSALLVSLRLQAVFFTLLPTVFLWFVYCLIEKRVDSLMRIAGIITVGAIALFVFTDLGVGDLGERINQRPREIRGSLFLPLTSVPVLVSAYALTLLGFHLRRSRDRRLKTALGLVLLGGFVTVVGAWIVDVGMPSFTGIELPSLGSLIPILFVPFLYRAMVRQRVFTDPIFATADEFFDELHDGVVILDRQDGLRVANSSAKRMLAIRDDTIGMNFMTEIMGVDADLIGSDPDGFKTTDGERVFKVSAAHEISRWEDMGKIVLIQDITQQARAADLLRRSRAELQREIENRTKKLRQAQRLESIGTLASGIAHHFNNLLTAIIGFTTAARDDMPQGSDIRDDLNEVLEASKRAKDIIQQLRSFGGQDDPASSVIDARRVIKDVLKLIESSSPQGVQVEMKLCAADSLVLANITQLHQVVLNLCTNAMHAMQKCGGTLTIGVEVSCDGPLPSAGQGVDGKTVCIAIADTGHGMTDVTLLQIFEPFYTTKPSGEGTGLGLPTCKRIVERLGGTIDVDSTPGQGSCFKVLLPLAERRYDSVSPPPEVSLDGGERLLFVDDQEQVLRAARRLLESLGYHVTTMADPEEALALITADPHRFDALIVDYSMPQLDGAKLARKVRTVRDDLPIIVASGSTGPVTTAACLDAGVNLVVEKPITKASLGGAVRRLLDERQTDIP